MNEKYEVLDTIDETTMDHYFDQRIVTSEGIVYMIRSSGGVVY